MGEGGVTGVRYLAQGASTAAGVDPWSATVVIELDPDASALLPTERGARAEALRTAVATTAHIDTAAVELPEVTVSPAGAAVLCVARDGSLMRCLRTVARRRATNPVEALHFAVHDHAGTA